MFGIDERALRAVWTVFLFGLGLALVYFIRDTILVFALAIFFAYMLWPVVGLIEKVIPRRRNFALAAVYIALIGLLVLVGFELIPAIASEATNLGTHLPKLLSGTKLSTIPLPSWMEPVRAQMITFVNEKASDLGARVVPFVQQVGTHVLTGLSAILPLILIPILAFFFIKDGEHIRNSLLGAVDDRHDRSLLDIILDDIHSLLKNYIRALVLMAVASFISWAIFLSVMRYPYELLLAGLAGIMEFIPVIGPAAAGIVIAVVCGASGAGNVLWIIVFWGIYRVVRGLRAESLSNELRCGATSAAGAVRRPCWREPWRHSRNVLFDSGNSHPAGHLYASKGFLHRTAGAARLDNAEVRRM